MVKSKLQLHKELRQMVRDGMPIEEIITRSQSVKKLINKLHVWKGASTENIVATPFAKLYQYVRSGANVSFYEFQVLVKYYMAIEEQEKIPFDITAVDHTEFDEFYCDKCGWYMAKEKKCDSCVPAHELPNDEEILMEA